MSLNNTNSFTAKAILQRIFEGAKEMWQLIFR
jgi:hypothetical protein